MDHGITVILLCVTGFINNPVNLSIITGEEVNLSCSHPLDKNEVNILWNTPPNTGLQTDTNTKLNITQSTLMFTAMNNSHMLVIIFVQLMWMDLQPSQQLALYLSTVCFACT